MIRIRTLTLSRFGHFTDKSFDFGPYDASKPDFHIIYGPNEAGKTTIMEAYLRLVYGIGKKENYAFLHDRKNLRVSGTFDIDGMSRFFSRLSSGHVSILQDVNGQVLSEASLQMHFGGFSQDDYRNLLCLDDATIEKGGEEIINSKSDIGNLLFSAAAGVSDLSKILEKVREEADGLFRKGSNKTEFARLREECKEIENKIKELDVSASKYKELEHQAQMAREEELRITDEKKALYLKRIHLETLRDALPKLQERDALAREITPFASWPEHMDIDPESLVEMLGRQTTATGNAEWLLKKIDDLRKEIVQLTVDSNHLALAEELQDQDIAGLRERYNTAMLDLARRRNELSNEIEKMQHVVRDLGAEEGSNPRCFVLPESRLQELENLRDKLIEAERQVKSEQDEIKKLADDIEQEQEKYNALVNTSSEPDLAEILERFDSDDLSVRYAAADTAVKTAKRQFEQALNALSVQGQIFETVPVSLLTSHEANRLVQEKQEIRIECDGLEGEHEKQKEEQEKLEAQITLKKQGSGLIDDVQARAEKAGRDKYWAEHKQEMSAASADIFEQAMQQFDRVQDTRLSTAKDLGELRQLEQHLADISVELASRAAKLQKLAADKQKIELKLAEAAEKAGLKQGSPADDFTDWLQKAENAAVLELELQRVRREHETVFEKADKLKGILSQHIKRDTLAFETLLVAAKTLEKEQKKQQDDCRSACESLKKLEQKQQQRSRNLGTLNTEADAVRNDWEKMVAEVFSGQIADQHLKNNLSPLRTLREHETACKGFEKQIAGMKFDQQQFEQKITDIASHRNIAVTNNFSELHDDMKKLADDAKAAMERKGKLEMDLEADEKEQRKVAEELSEIQRQVQKLGEIFPSDVARGTLQELRTAVSKASDIIDKRKSVQTLENELRTGLGKQTLDEIRSVLHAKTQQGLRMELEETAVNLEKIEQDHTAAVEKRRDAENKVYAVTGGSDIAELVECKETIELEMRETASRHLELDLGHQLAEEAIRRYRDKHRSGMMQATEQAFSELTNGAYTRLQTQPDGNKEFLIAVDAKGQTKRADEMSKGTRFQLYLALRAAAYEQQLASQGKCLPFFCDDIFETFDEERTRSACRLMNRIGNKGQAIYLTHHHHVVDIAREVCGNDVNIHYIQ